MRKCGALILISLFLITGSVRSQVILSLIFGDKLNSDELMFGIHMHYSWNNLSNMDPSSSLNKFNLGLFLTYKLNEKWQLNTEPMAKYSRGATGMTPYTLGDPALDATFSGGSFSRKAGYVGLPITVRYLLAERFFIEAGPNIELRINAEDEFKVSTPYGDQLLKVDSEDLTSRWDFGLLAGAGTYMGKGKDIALGLRWAPGISDVMKDYDGTQAHQAFYVYLNLPIGRGKKVSSH